MNKKLKSNNKFAQLKNIYFFQYAATAWLNYEKIGKNSGRKIKVKDCIYKHNLEGIKYPSKKWLEKCYEQ